MSAYKVLISEDDLAIATMLTLVLEEEGYDVAVAYSAGAAVELATAFQPDTILIGNDGFGTFEPGWRAAERLAQVLPHVPRIMLSTSDAAVAEGGVTERGKLFNAVLRKPFPLGVLLNLIRDFCLRELPGSALERTYEDSLALRLVPETQTELSADRTPERKSA